MSSLEPADGPGPQAFQIYTVRGRSVNPHVDLDRISALIAEDDESDYSTRKNLS
jgi:hypothetical protein